jgi:TPR repeat protein
VFDLLMLLLPVRTNALGVVEREPIEAIKTKVETSDPVAKCQLGIYYFLGRDAKTNHAEAVRWFLAASEQGDALAQAFLASCYDRGLGVQKDEAKSLYWRDMAVYNANPIRLFRFLAESGSDWGQLELGKCYAAGKGVPGDDQEAVKWLRKAAEQGNARAQALLGGCFQGGKGVSRNYAQAVEWFRRAANQGDALGQGLLGWCYSDGLGVARNDIEAYKWLNLGSAHIGDLSNQKLADGFAEKLRPCESRMSREEIIEAQRLSAAFVPRTETHASSKSSGFLGIQLNEMVHPRATGTAFFITEDGFLITSEHVISGAARVRLVTSAGLVDATVVNADAANDLALLKARGRFFPLPVATSRAVRQGNTVATVGFPNIGLQGFAPKLAKGEIAALSGVQDDARHFQISVPVQPGNSGGALVDERGNVIGVVSAKLSASAALAATGELPENVSYAIKSSFVLGFLESVPDASTKLKEPNSGERKFEDVVKSAEQAAALVLVY